jgi:uncharacterized protein YrzB (UPF0473 family)
MEEIDMSYSYDVVLSFAGEDRNYAEELAQKLKEKGIKVFYDNWNISSLWGENLYAYLSKKYSDSSLFCVTIISRSYCKKKWTMHELEFIQEREFNGDVYWLPLLLEDVDVPGLAVTRGRINSTEHSIDEIVQYLCEKIQKKKFEISNSDDESKLMEVIGESGNKEIVEVVCAFEFKDNHKEYVVYTKNETDKNGNVTVYVSNVDRRFNEPQLIGVDNEKEWDRIKEVLRELSTPDEDDDDDIEII